ncbi:inositol hexakisphosphate and diphosphoinositol-pentakisphosphate kinase [Rhizoctonia solani]
MKSMKVAMYSTRQYDRRSFEGESEHITAAGIEITYLEPHLNVVTAKLAEGHQAVCLFVNDDASEETLRVLHSQGIKYIAMRCAGYNNVDLKVAEELGISVVNVPAYSPEAGIHKSYNRVREGNFLLDGLMGFNLEGKTIGIIGTGKIGKWRILAHGFRAKVIGYDPYPSPTAAENGIQYVSLDELFKASDIISLHCPLTPDTEYIVNEEALKTTKPVNTSRGALINTADLIHGLKSGHIGAVGMDVYERESKYFFRDSSNKIIQDDQLSRLVSFHNVFISGHQAFLTKEALSAIARSTVENLSTDFPLFKAVEYVKLRNPVCINDLHAQALLWDRRVVVRILDHFSIPTPRRLIASRDGGAKLDADLLALVESHTGLRLNLEEPMADVRMREDGEAIIVNGQVMEKPFVEKPVNGEDHNVYIYFKGGQGRRLFRKVGNKSSELDPTLSTPRMEGSYVYEEFIDVDNAEDIKVYTVGPTYTHAETRKSPVVDGVVRRNTEGKEIRFITHLSDEEKSWASKICEAFGQRVCGFDVLRCDGGARSMVIDVNGWSFVKGNETYYDKAAEILADVCFKYSIKPGRAPGANDIMDDGPQWTLKANVTVFRHADRTPKQKLKFNFPVSEPWTKPFVDLLNGEKEEIILRESEQLKKIAEAIQQARDLGASGEDLNKLTQLNNALFSKIDLPGTKAQLKPGFTKGKAVGPRKLEKLQLVFKWGGEFTHAARYQSRDLGESMKKDITIMNKDVLNNVKIFTSSERRVTASAEIFAAALLDSSSATNATNSTLSTTTTATTTTINPSSAFTTTLTPTKSSHASDSGSIMSVKVPTYQLIIRKDLLDDSNAAKDLTDDVKKRLKFLLRPGESERRPELTWPKGLKKEPVEVVREVIELLTKFREVMRKNFETMDVERIQQRWCCGDEPWLFRERWEKLFEDFCNVKQEKFDPSRVSELYDTLKYCALHHRTFLFAIFDENGGSELGAPQNRTLHELYGRAKALFDLVAPQEYGIEPAEKEEIGVLTSLPLLRNVVHDLEEARNSGECSLTLYFTKESHIHTLVNLVLLSGLPIANPRIPELDYASHITFELYERVGGRDGRLDKEYSIRLALSEGAHSSNVLDSALDARHSLNVKQKKKLTQHLPYDMVIEKLSKHFHRVPNDEDMLSDPNPEAIVVPLVGVPEV